MTGSDPTAVLQSARVLALRVMDKNIGPLSEQARELLGEINECLNDLPSVEELQRIFRAAKPRPNPDCPECHGWAVTVTSQGNKPCSLCGTTERDIPWSRA